MCLEIPPTKYAPPLTAHARNLGEIGMVDFSIGPSVPRVILPFRPLALRSLDFTVPTKAWFSTGTYFVLQGDTLSPYH